MKGDINMNYEIFKIIILMILFVTAMIIILKNKTDLKSEYIAIWKNIRDDKVGGDL